MKTNMKKTKDLRVCVVLCSSFMYQYIPPFVVIQFSHENKLKKKKNRKSTVNNNYIFTSLHFTIGVI